MNFFKLTNLFILLIISYIGFGQTAIINETFPSSGLPTGWTSDVSGWACDATNGRSDLNCISLLNANGFNKSFYIPITFKNGSIYNFDFYSKKHGAITIIFNDGANTTTPLYSYTQVAATGNNYVNVVSGNYTNNSGSDISGYAVVYTTTANYGSSTCSIDDFKIYETTPVNYYSKSSGNLNELSNWGTNIDGSGTAPSNFTSAYQTFHIRNNTTHTIGGVWTVSGTGSKIIVGDGTNPCDFTIPASYAVTGTIDVSSNGTLSIAHLTTNPTIGSLASGSTVDYKGAGAQTIANGSYHHLKLSTSGAKTLIASVTSIAGNLTTSGTATTATVVGLTIGGNLNIGDGTTFTNAGHSLTVTGTTTIGSGTSGTLIFSNATNPVRTFTGLVTINSGGSWTESAAVTPVFIGGITKVGTFTSNTGVHTFSTNSQGITGALLIPSVTITNITLTCSSSSDLTVNTALVLDETAVLDMTTSQLLGSLTTLTNNGTIKTSNLGATPIPTGKTWGGAVEFNASSNQTLMAGSYNNLKVSGSGNKTLSGSVTIGASGILSLSGGIIVPGANVLTVDNTSSSAVSTGSSLSFVSGALKRKIATGTGAWNFPVGIGGSYYPFVLTNPTQVTGYTTVSVTASTTGGTAGTCNSSISTSEYWTVVTTSNLSAGFVSLGKPTLGVLNTVSQSNSSTLNSTYVSRYGTVSGNSVVNSNTIAVSTTTSYFVLSTAASTLPTITSPTSASVTSTSVTLGGNITSLNCSNIIERGIYFSTTNGFSDGTGTKVSVSSGPYSTGVFTIGVTGLVPNTVYYYKAFATNSSGSSYTIQGTFTTTSQTFPIQEGFNNNTTFPTTNGSNTLGGWEINTGSGGTCNASRSELPVNSSNAWLFTPPFYATSGKIYTLSYLSKYSERADVSIYLTDSQDSSAVISSNLFNSVDDDGSSFISATADEWVCQTSGVYYFAFKVSTVGSTCQFDCISINETTPATITWTGSSSSKWSTAANWDLNRTPNSTDIIIIPAGVISGKYPITIPNGSYYSLSLNLGTSGTTTIGTTTFSGNVTLNSSFTSNTITFNGTTSIGGNLAVGTSGNNFNFTVNGATNVNGTFTLGAVNTAVTTTINNPITVVGAFTMGNNSNHATTISYANSTTKAITASNSGNLIFYGTVNYTASSGDQIIMKSQYNGAVSATNGAKRYMEGDLDLNSSLTMSAGDWYCGSPTSISISGTQGTDHNVKLSNSPYKGSGISGRWQGIFVASDLGSIGANDLITSISFFIDEKFSDRAYNNFTIKAALISTDRFTQLQPSGYWPFFSVPMTTVFFPKNVTTIDQSWNNHSFDVPFTWDGVSNILIEITFNNLAVAGGSGLAPDGTSDDKVAYIGGAWGNNIIVQTSSANSNITTTSNGSNSNYKNVSMFNAANGPYNINITNNWLNTGANFYHMRNTVTFDGTSNQHVTTRGDNYFNYVVNNTYNNGFSLTLNDDCEVENNATFQDGVINTGSNKLVLMSSDASKLLSYSNASYVKGTLRRFIANNTSIYAFPLGKGYSSSTYFLSDVINSNLVGVNYLDGLFVDGFPSGYSQSTFQSLGKQLSGSGVITRDIKRLDQAGYTQLDPNQQPSGGSYSLKMYAENYTLVDWIDNHQCIMKRPTGSNNLNDFNMAGTISADDGLGRLVGQQYLLSTNLTSFSEFAPGLGNPVALPIELLYFDVKTKNKYANLVWKTGSELNNDYFSVERSKDGINFKQIGKVKGSGTRSYETNYVFIDSFPLSGLSYYRLKQVDYDAKFEYSPIKAINFDFSAQNDFIIYPNPLENNDLEFFYSTDNEDFALIQIIEPLGRVILSKKELVNEGRNYFKINLYHLPKGPYFLVIKDKFGNQVQRKFIL